MDRKLIILDRDGVINHDSDLYIKSADEWIPIDGSLEAIAALYRNNYAIAIATNQSGLSRGFFTDHDLHQIHKKMKMLLHDLGARVDIVRFCPHLPEHKCNCRKPLPGLYLSISSFLSVPLNDVPIVGDSLRDIQAAVAVGASPYLVLTGKGQLAARDPALPKHTKIYADLASVVDSLLKHG